MSRPEPGKVYFVGAGPGAPDLITVRGARVIAAADLVLYTDSLVTPGLAADLKPGAAVRGSAGMTLDEIMDEMVPVAQRRGIVARVHTGDPTIFGAIFEQIVRLDQAGIPWEIVPGVSSVTAAAAACRAELTVSEISQTIILTRVEGRTPVPPGEQLRDLARHGATIALFLSASLLHKAEEELLAGGYPADTPVAVVQKATWPDEQIVRTTIARMMEDTRAANIRMHAMVLVGPCLDPDLHAQRSDLRSKLYDENFTHGHRVAKQLRRGGRD